MSEHIGSVRQGGREYTIVLDYGAPGFYEWELLATSWIPEHGYERGSAIRCRAVPSGVTPRTRLLGA